jgi:hypothetical protein
VASGGTAVGAAAGGSSTGASVAVGPQAASIIAATITTEIKIHRVLRFIFFSSKLLVDMVVLASHYW